MLKWIKLAFFKLKHEREFNEKMDEVLEKVAVGFFPFNAIGLKLGRYYQDLFRSRIENLTDYEIFSYEDAYDNEDEVIFLRLLMTDMFREVVISEGLYYEY